MKNILIFIGCLFFQTGYAQVISLSIETINSNIGVINDLNEDVDLTGYATYRLYAICATEETKVITIWGNAQQIGAVASTTSFWNSNSSQFIAGDFNPALYTSYPSMAFDSWLTIGCENSIDCGANPQFIDLDGYFSSYQCANKFRKSFGNSTCTDGSAFLMDRPLGTLLGIQPYYSQPAGPDLKILLGQFTTTGEIYGQLNLQYLSNTSCGDPLSIASLPFGNYSVGCSDPIACNYDPAYDAFLPQLCSLAGCTNPSACNYDGNASCDDGSCSFVPGCTDPAACNYNPLAVCDDNSCGFIFGCTDPSACNWYPFAVCDDGSCSGLVGCGNPDACNYNPDVTCNDFTYCIMPGCDDPTACNYDPNVCAGGNCEGILGCTFPSASNYNPSAACDDGNCIIGGCLDNTACNFFPLATFDDGSCVGLKGCMNALACNYNPEATCQSGSCQMPGCTIPDACNYNPNSCGPGGYCSDYGTIYFFNDMNADGFAGSFEGSFSSHVTLHLEPGNIDIESYNSNFVSLNSLPNGNYDVTIIDYESGWQLTTSQVFSITNPCNIHYIGFTNGTQNQCLTSTGFGSLNCTNNFHGTISYANYGTDPVNLNITLEYSNSLTFNYASSSTSHTATTIEWLIPNYEAGLSSDFYFNLIPPILSEIGQSFQFNVVIVATLASGEVLCNTNIPISRVFLCGYDPNDKVAEPIGYRDEHFILNDQELLYTIHFQNTGNAPAETVTIIDEMDTNIFDLHSLHLIYATHPVFDIVDHNNQFVEFEFDNILLPDSASFEEESHGYVMFSIKLKENLPPNTQIENAAAIYFDYNEPVITSTTHHTIFDCESLSVAGDFIFYCEGDSGTFTVDIPYAESLTWYNQNEIIGAGESVVLNSTDNPSYSVNLVAENPLCSRTSEFFVEVLPSPIVTIDVDLAGIFFGPEDYSYDWYANDILIPNEHDYTLNLSLDDGTIVHAFVTDFDGCGAETNTLVVNSVSINSIKNFTLYPNPMSEFATLTTPSGYWNIRMFNSTGQLLWSAYTSSGMHQISRANLSAGIYSIQIAGAQTSQTMRLVVE